MNGTKTMEKLADEISHAAEDLERTDTGHTPQWLGGYIGGLAAALAMLIEARAGENE